MKDDRFNSKKWFITFSQLNDNRPPDVESSMQFFLQWMEEGLPNNKVIKAVLCHEDHEDTGDVDGGCGVHIHLIFELEKKQKWPSDMDFFDGLYAHHPNIQTLRNWQKSVHYLCAPQDKNDHNPDYASYGVDVDAVLQALTTKKGYGFHEAANAIYKEGKTLRQVHDENPGFYAREKRKLEEYAKQVNEWKQQDQVKSPFPGFKDAVPRDRPLRTSESDLLEWQKIIDWSNVNFTQPRQRRQDQLWIYGPKGIGKSMPFDTTVVPYKEAYSWNYENRQDEQLQTCDFVLMDEMNGGVTLSFFKLFAQMSGTAKVTYRYGKLETFKRNIPLVVISNVHPDDIYHNAKFEDKEAIKDRFVFANPQFPYYLELNDDSENSLLEEDHSEESMEERRKRRKK